MQYNFIPLKNKIKDVGEWLRKENSSIRTSRANISVLDSVFVDAYNSKVPLNQVAGLTSEDARTIRIAPWDMSQLKEIEKALNHANLGVSIAVDDKGIRLSFPPMTTERRIEVTKIAKEKLEQARITVRKLRDEAWDEIQAKEKEGGMSEDEKFRFKAEMEKLITEGTKTLEDLYKKKEEEILN